MAEWDHPRDIALYRGVSAAVQLAIENLDPEHKDKGGYFRLYKISTPFNGVDGLILLCGIWVGGKINIDKRATYEKISAEKAERLAANFLKDGHLTSMRSRNPENQQFGGAIILSCSIYSDEPEDYSLYLLSFSGLPEEADEAAMVMTPILTEGWDSVLQDSDTVGTIHKVLEESPNELTKKLLRKWFLEQIPIFKES